MRPINTPTQHPRFPLQRPRPVWIVLSLLAWLVCGVALGLGVLWMLWPEPEVREMNLYLLDRWEYEQRYGKDEP